MQIYCNGLQQGKLFLFILPDNASLKSDLELTAWANFIVVKFFCTESPFAIVVKSKKYK